MLTTEIGGINWAYRPETNDLGIIEQVFSNNGAYMPDDMTDWLVIDIGAHIGAASVLAAQRGARVKAYEPSSSAYQALLANILNNGLPVEPYHVGVGTRGIRKLYLDVYNTGQNSEFLIYPELDLNTFEFMNVISLGEVLYNPLEGICDFLKLDCEGCEDRIIRDILGGLHSRIRRISVEFHNDTKDDLLKQLSEFYSVKFMGYGYYLEQ